jgi:hypothetical protein
MDIARGNVARPRMRSKLNTLVAEPLPLPQRNRAVLTVLTGTQTGRVVELMPGVPLILGRSEECQLRFDDASVSGKHATVVGMLGGHHFLDAGSTNGSAVNSVRAEPNVPIALTDGARIQLGSGTLLRFALVDDAEVRAMLGMYEAAFRDALTGVYNRKYLDERLEAELAFALRHGTELSVILLDVDHFKSVNDTHGHLAGDAILKTTAGVLWASPRCDVAATSRTKQRCSPGPTSGSTARKSAGEIAWSAPEVLTKNWSGRPSEGLLN